jgi:hypothetical protein
MDFLESNNRIFLKATMEFSKRQWNFQNDNRKTRRRGIPKLGRPVIAGENILSELQPAAGELLQPDVASLFLFSLILVSLF